MIEMVMYIPIWLFLLSCNHKEKFIQHKEHFIEMYSVNDSTILDSMLYSKKFSLKYSQNDKSFSSSIDSLNQHINAKTEIEDHNITYNIDLNRNNVKNKFNWQIEDDYTITKMEIGIDNKFVDITNLNFDNIYSKKVYPSGVWHWTVEDCSAKYVSCKGKEYFFINGASLFCNGSSCNTYQLYVIVKEGNKLDFSALEYYDLLPYYFNEMNLFDKNSDGIPEFYLPKGSDATNISLKSFECYSFNLNNKIIKI